MADDPQFKDDEAKSQDAGDDAARKSADLAQKWRKEITRHRDKERKWREQARQVIDRYRDDRGLDDTLAKFNILWANTEVLKPAIFARMPVPDVRRRFPTADAAARTAALIMERALAFSTAVYDFRDVLDRVNEDYVLPGRSIALVCYEPLILSRQVKKPVEPLPPAEEPDMADEQEPVHSGAVGETPGPSPDMPAEPGGTFQAQQYPEGTQFDDQGQPFATEDQEYKAWESVYCEYVRWDLFGFSECKQWSKCPAMWIGEYFSREDLEAACPDFKDWDMLPWSKAEHSDAVDAQPPQTILVWKVWHRASRKYLMVADKYEGGVLKSEDDPQQLEKFFPVPQPLYSLRNNGTWIPKPEFLLYQDQAIELDEVTNRLRNLVKACKNRGVYDKAMDEIAKISDLVKKPDNEFIPVPDFSRLAEKGGLEGIIAAMPLEQIVACIGQLREREAELKQQIYEIYGLADIMRGASEATETLGAQQLKAQYGGLRISTRQERFQEFVRDLYRIQAEIIAEHFDPDTLRLMSGIQVLPDQIFQQMKAQEALPAGAVSQSEFAQAIQILKSDKLRGFKVDIETDSTIPVDKQQDQQNRIAFIQAVGQYLQGVIPAVQSGAIDVKIAREGLLFVVRGFKIGTELEEVLEELGQNQDQAQQLGQLKQVNQQLQEQLQDLQKQLQQAQQNNAKDMARAQADITVSNVKAKNEMAVDAAEARNDMAIDAAKAMHEGAIHHVKTVHEIATKLAPVPPQRPQ